MGPMLGAMLVGLFFLLAAGSAGVAVVFTALVVRGMIVRRSHRLGLYIIGSGLAGAAVAVVFGRAMAWNVVGMVILEQGLVGYLAWGTIGYVLSAAAAFVVSLLVR